MGHTDIKLTKTEVRDMADELEPDGSPADSSPAGSSPADLSSAAPADSSSAAPSVTEPVTGEPGPAASADSGAVRVLRAIDRGPRTKPWRVLSIVLLVLGCVLAPIGVTAGWAKNLVTNQDAYLAAVSPLITDPVIVNAAETRLVSAIDDAISNLQIADKVGDEL